MIKYIVFALFLLTIPAANWMIGNIGLCVPNGPCLIPVGFGLMAPSGVLLIGLAIVLRDYIHTTLGIKWVYIAITTGAFVAFLVSPPYLVVASVAAFVLSELADTVVYAPLYRKRLVTAIVASGVMGAVVDSAVFLIIAFGSFQYIEGQVVGKLVMTVAAIPVVMLLRAYRKPAIA